MNKERFFKEVFQPSDQLLERLRTQKRIYGIYGIYGVYGENDQVTYFTNELKF